MTRVGTTGKHLLWLVWALTQHPHIRFLSNLCQYTQCLRRTALLKSAPALKWGATAPPTQATVLSLESSVKSRVFRQRNFHHTMSIHLFAYRPVWIYIHLVLLEAFRLHNSKLSKSPRIDLIPHLSDKDLLSHCQCLGLIFVSIFSSRKLRGSRWNQEGYENSVWM